MSEGFFNRVLQIGFLLFFAIALAYSAYSLYNPSDKATRDLQQKLCETAIAKSAIVERFMYQAADARRAGAAAETNPIAAKNDIHAAEQYESDAKRYDELTVKDCKS